MLPSPPRLAHVGLSVHGVFLIVFPTRARELSRGMEPVVLFSCDGHLSGPAGDPGPLDPSEAPERLYDF